METHSAAFRLQSAARRSRVIAQNFERIMSRAAASAARNRLLLVGEKHLSRFWVGRKVSRHLRISVHAPGVCTCFVA